MLMVSASMPPGSSGGNLRTIRQILSASEPLCGGSRFSLIGVASLLSNLGAHLHPDRPTKHFRYKMHRLRPRRKGNLVISTILGSADPGSLAARCTQSRSMDTLNSLSKQSGAKQWPSRSSLLCARRREALLLARGAGPSQGASFCGTHSCS